ncbi:MAG TPA: hypothetical protein VK548_02330 [Candidatus Acidoferrum sp.]|nr:hypothetical protein [Candidatus Acidoferrum sp.]
MRRSSSSRLRHARRASAGASDAQHDGAQQLGLVAAVSGFKTSIGSTSGVFVASTVGAAQQLLEVLNPRSRFPKFAKRPPCFAIFHSLQSMR